MAVGSLLSGAPIVDRTTGAEAQSGKPAGAERQAASAPSVTKASASACDRWAAPWGSKHGNGSARHPVRGPYKLVRILHSGQTGCLRRGLYHERQTTVKRHGVTLRSAPGERATWRGRIVLQGRRDRLLNLNLDGSYGPRCHSSACGTLPSPTINAPDVTIAGNNIKSPDSGICVHPRAWGSEHPDRFQIIGNRIHDCGRMPHTDHDHGIYVASGSDGVIAGNVIFHNADRGIQLYPDAHRTLVQYNTVDGNGSGIIYSEYSSGNDVRDNVFTNSVVRWNAESYNLSGGGNAFYGNCVKAANPRRRYNQNGGVELPSRVVQRGNRRAGKNTIYASRKRRDFRIRHSSPCSGKGAPDWVAAP